MRGPKGIHSAFVKLSRRDTTLNQGLNVRFGRSVIRCGLGMVSGLTPRDATSVRGSVTGKRRDRMRNLLFSVVATTRRRKVRILACEVITRGFGWATAVGYRAEWFRAFIPGGPMVRWFGSSWVYCRCSPSAKVPAPGYSDSSTCPSTAASYCKLSILLLPASSYGTDVTATR